MSSTDHLRIAESALAAVGCEFKDKIICVDRSMFIFNCTPGYVPFSVFVDDVPAREGRGGDYYVMGYDSPKVIFRVALQPKDVTVPESTWQKFKRVLQFKKREHKYHYPVVRIREQKRDTHGSQK